MSKLFFLKISFDSFILYKISFKKSLIVEITSGSLKSIFPENNFFDKLAMIVGPIQTFSKYHSFIILMVLDMLLQVLMSYQKYL